jgi:hypothetical protein
MRNSLSSLILARVLPHTDQQEYCAPFYLVASRKA